MLAFHILDIKDFMNKLLIGDLFDLFYVHEVSITTFNTFTIDGRLRKDFFDTDSAAALEESGQRFSLWKDIRPFCYSIIKGKLTPVGFHIVLQLPAEKIQHLLTTQAPDVSPDSISALYLNIQYKDKTLVCTTGISFHTFVPDKRPGLIWDQTISSFFKNHQIQCELR